MHWYVIRTKPHQERRAEFHLRQLSVETFLPLLKQTENDTASRARWLWSRCFRDISLPDLTLLIVFGPSTFPEVS